MEVKHADTLGITVDCRAHAAESTSAGPTISSTVKFAREKITDAWAEALPLMAAHREEVGVLDANVFDPKLETYQKLDAAGVLWCFTARVDGRLVGYSLLTVSPHLHYPLTVWANQDALFMLPKYRGMKAIWFVNWIDAELAADGIDFVCRGVTEKNDYSRSLTTLGYEQIERVYMRRL